MVEGVGCMEERLCFARHLRRQRVEPAEREFFIDNLLVPIHLIIEMIWWTGLAPWEFEFPFPGSLISTFLGASLRRAPRAPSARGTCIKNNYFTEMCSGSEAGSYLRLIDFVSLNSGLESHKEEKKKEPALPGFGYQVSGFGFQV